MAPEFPNVKMSAARDCLCLALDRLDRETILSLADNLHQDIGCFKINAAFVQYGPQLVRELKARDVKIFLDLKFHDIPATVAEHVRAASSLGVDWLTVHAGGGKAMLRAAAKARDDAPDGHRARVLAVTVLTSLDRRALNDELRVAGSVEEHVAHLAELTADCGLDGLVCSAADLPAFRNRLPSGFAIVTPGISGVSGDGAGSDQKRIADPLSAVRNGATMLVIGRAILEAADPVVAAQAIRQAIAAREC